MLFCVKIARNQIVAAEMQNTREKKYMCFLIVPQLGAVLTNQGWAHFALEWKIQPRKQKKELPEP